MRVSLPTPLGPLMTMIRGLGFGERGSKLKWEPMEAYRVWRRRLERFDFSKVGIGMERFSSVPHFGREEGDFFFLVRSQR